MYDRRGIPWLFLVKWITNSTAGQSHVGSVQSPTPTQHTAAVVSMTNDRFVCAGRREEK